jgi:YD repeat-containing protein
MEITGVKVGNDYHDKAVTRFYYDLNGNLVKKIDPEGVTEIYQYDSRDRMIRSRRGR